MPAVCRIFDVPNEVQVTSLDLVSVTAQLASLVERRSERVKTVLITLLTKDAELPNDESCSDLAIAFFICRNCRRLYHYSKVVAHQCVRFEYVDGEGVDGWCLLDGCAKDPSTTTRQDLDDMSMRVGSIQSFDVWRHALNVGAREEVMWRIATPGETATANEVEAKLEHSSMNGYEDQHGWCCLRTAHAREEKLPDGPKMLCAVAPARGMRHGTIEVVFVSTT
ncbi:hypothetical protein POSPLADRAFT_1049447 [Postia placenta MAD-698-R-SB12]|uniref:Uncharacterized protein n=1 Tax=Postia placenta MAD-698-R-SB12 TaxID=670580 RepID=A0A1X6MPT1_9APHY|nr:hypothetical protein POSPLADRAFT_1049447 [Postia placenta MAD-698-R-SB12]OSX58202.1 hypothetical protein POSPLADRAFT_1049447 [Postia placenta MAD-698-R-SB12]